MGAPDKIKSPVESFSCNINDYKSDKKNETELSEILIKLL